MHGAGNTHPGRGSWRSVAWSRPGQGLADRRLERTFGPRKWLKRHGFVGIDSLHRTRDTIRYFALVSRENTTPCA